MILLFENKEIRQKDVTIVFDDNIIHNILGDDKCNEVLSSFLEDESQLESYDTIIIHESIYFENERDTLLKKIETYCSQKEKKLVKFSGHNTQAHFNNKLLEISSKSLYENLTVFLEKYINYDANILMLAYGKNWQLNLLLNILEKLNIFIENSNKNESFDFDEFEDDFDLLKIKNILGNSEYKKLLVDIDDDEISIIKVKLLADNLKKIIQEKANE